MQIALIPDHDKLKYKELLLLGDEQMSMIERYLWRSDLFALLCDDDAVAITAVTDEGDGNIEIKNLTVRPEMQRKGYGSALISFVKERYRGCGKMLYVGTGENPDTLRFYEMNGFEYSHTVRDFFSSNYDHPIYENGKMLRDMIYLKCRL